MGVITSVQYIRRVIASDALFQNIVIPQTQSPTYEKMRREIELTGTAVDGY